LELYGLAGEGFLMSCKKLVHVNSRVSTLRALSGRSQSGFTLIEMLIIVIIVLILAAVALPHYVGSQDKSREATVKNNMRVAQIAAEGYAAEKGGLYPDKIDQQYFSFFPGGPGDGKFMGNAHGPVNPYTHKNEWPIAGTITDVQMARTSAPTSVGSAGQIEYSPIAGTNGVRAYAIRGARKNGLALEGSTPMSTFVLTRQN
jgi:prepilin-type N-terminal cleavage/methylation domain-containing protein